MNHVNTQVAEELNNSLRKLSTVVAYSSFDNYLKIIEIFITIKNSKIQRIIWKCDLIGYGDYRELLTFVWGWYFPRGDYRCPLHMVFTNKVKVSCNLLRGEGGGAHWALISPFSWSLELFLLINPCICSQSHPFVGNPTRLLCDTSPCRCLSHFWMPDFALRCWTGLAPS